MSGGFIDVSGTISQVGSVITYYPETGVPKVVVWPVTFEDDVTLKLTSNLTLDNIDQYFDITSNNVTINGDDKTVTIDGVLGYGGLISSSKDSTSIINIGLLTSNASSLLEDGGWVGRSFFNGTITSCYSTGDISGSFSGGIAGYGAGGNNGTCTITDCNSTGAISGFKSGGIAGSSAGIDNGTCTITSCVSSGDIIGGGSGGIAGGSAGFVNGTCTITSCYSSGDIIGGGSGGIAGGSVGGNNGTCTITSCYSTGDISGGNSGGIAGSNAGVNNGTCNIKNCYATGIVTGGNSGGIVGYDAFYTEGTCIVTHCYITGSPSGIFTPEGSYAQVINSTYSDGWDDLVASDGLLNPSVDSVWKLIYTNRPWKLKVFLPIMNPIYNSGTLVYTSPFPISAYPNALTVKLINNGIVYEGSTVTLNQKDITFTGVQGINNNFSTYLVLYSGTELFDYANSFIVNICFRKGTMILTPSGYKCIESLNVGHLVQTAQGRNVQITKIEHFIGKKEDCPLYVIHKDSFAPNVPLLDLYMSEGHAYHYKGHWTHMKCSSIAMKLDTDDIEYYNIAVENYLQHTLVANGVEVESLFNMKDLEMTWNCKADNCKPVITMK